MLNRCSHCIIGKMDLSRAPCQNCWDRYAKTEIQKATLEFVKEKARPATKEEINELKIKGENSDA